MASSMPGIVRRVLWPYSGGITVGEAPWSGRRTGRWTLGLPGGGLKALRARYTGRRQLATSQLSWANSNYGRVAQR